MSWRNPSVGPDDHIRDTNTHRDASHREDVGNFGHDRLEVEILR